MPQEDKPSHLKQLITKGKGQGFLTYAEVNDHLPDDAINPDQIEDIIGMINDMGIEVHDKAPDGGDTPILIEEAPTPSEEDEDATAAALAASAESDYGRTTDPTRMYMREMGAVDLLTREGELKIAKRIEEGINQVLAALSTYPGAIAGLLRIFDKVESGELRFSDVVTRVGAYVHVPPAVPTAIMEGHGEDEGGGAEQIELDSTEIDPLGVEAEVIAEAAALISADETESGADADPDVAKASLLGSPIEASPDVRS